MVPRGEWAGLAGLALAGRGEGPVLGTLTPLLSLEGGAAKEENSLVGSPSRMLSQLRQEDSAVLQQLGSISLRVFPEKSNLLFVCLLRSLNMASVVSYA